MNIVEWHERWLLPCDDGLRAHLEYVYDFGEKNMLPASAYKSIEVEGNFPEDVIAEMGRFGWLGFPIPEVYGGWGRSAADTVHKMRMIAYLSPSTSLILAAHWLSASTILLGGTKEQQERILPKLASRDLGCFALTEPNAGSDARAMRTTARREGDTWKINGSKTFITSALHGKYMTLMARTKSEHGNFSAFSVESDTSGFELPGLKVIYQPKPAFSGSWFGDVFFDDLELPHDALIGEEGRGFEDVALKTLDGGRINIAAQAIGLAMKAYDEAYAYADSRKMYGTTLLKIPDVEQRFADAKTRLDKTWAQVVSVAQSRDPYDPDAWAKAAAVKVKATETGFQIAAELADCFGGTLTDPKCRALRHMNNLKVACNYEGANGVLRAQRKVREYLNQDLQ